MTTPRIPPPNRGTEPEKSIQTPHRKIEKVEKTSEVDEESQARKFRQFVEHEEEEEPKSPKYPTPLSLISNTTKSSGTPMQTDDLQNSLISSPSYSPPPSSLLNDLVPIEKDEENALPHSGKFWQTVDEPPNTPLSHTTASMQETPRSSTRIFQTKEEKSQQNEPFAPIPQTKEEKSKQGHSSPEKPFEKEKKQQPLPHLLISPTNTPLPEAVIPQAIAATQAAQPYLSPDILSVYFHMVGTIVAMVSPNGDSSTEFVLNAPPFANSKFYGSTITIDRFASAPYQINVRLTGSNEAVNLFNQNLPNLMASFREGKFSFTINRIDAVYETPLIRRKEASRDKGEQGSQR